MITNREDIYPFLSTAIAYVPVNMAICPDHLVADYLQTVRCMFFKMIFIFQVSSKVLHCY